MSAQPTLFQASLADVFAAHPGRVRRTDPITSQEAARRAAPKMGSQTMAVLAVLADAPDGLTGHEACAVTPCKYPHVSTTRLADLTGWGLARKTDRTRPTDGNGNRALVWEITDAGRWVAEEARRAAQQ